MADNTQFQQVLEASWEVVNSYHETSQAVVDSLVTLQGCYLRFAQSIFQTWIEVLTPQTQSTPRLPACGQPSQQQQDACQRLISTKRRSMDGNQSEVAALRARLDRECEAYSLFLNGFAIAASHTAITKRMEAFGLSVEEIHTALVPLIGAKEATKTIRNALQVKVQ